MFPHLFSPGFVVFAHAAAPAAIFISALVCIRALDEWMADRYYRRRVYHREDI